MSEDEILASLFERLGPADASLVVPPGDDCAAIEIGSGQLLLLAADQVVGGRHYQEDGPDAATPEEVGRKLLGRNLSDIAAMGGEPRHCLVTCALPRGYQTDWLHRFYDGVAAFGREHGVAMIGGDLAKSSHDLVASLTITGTVSPQRICRRNGARAGDWLLATGMYGRSFPTGHHLTFQPRCKEGRWLGETGCVHAMIRVSDAVLLDATRLCRASGVSLDLRPEALPRRTESTTTAQALTDGEDYELLAAVHPDDAVGLLADWPFEQLPLSHVGEFREAGPASVRLPEDLDIDVPEGGYDHFRTDEA